ncbi:THUMP domain protein [Rhodotorula toruloides]|uniref:THUMP domain protein n=1 Tax=Rhodotorula toruloides TaxID=5286 RepID=A0A511KPW3_RHOTO|nr:THUMP domain protein [Rhodotorula toruloides]
MTNSSRGAGKTGRGGKAAGGKGGKGKGGHNWSSKRPVGGKGIFVTTLRGKESRCVGEIYDLLDEVADRLYPPERVKALQDEREARLKEVRGEGAMVDEDGEAGQGEAARSEPQAQPPIDSDDDDDEDIEASIERELAALKAGRGAQGLVKKESAGAKDKGKAKERPRFQSIQTDTECLCFIATAWPHDPVELTEAIVSEVQETGQARTRFVQRLTPTSFTCHSLSVEQVEMQSSRLIEQVFTSWAQAHDTTSVTYAIETSVRSHTAPLSRTVLLPLLGAQIAKLASAPTISSPVPDRPILSVRADLKNPDVVLLATVLKNVYGLSIVEGRLWKGKKFNLAEIAAQKRKDDAREDDEQKAEAEEAAATVEA